MGTAIVVNMILVSVMIGSVRPMPPGDEPYIDSDAVSMPPEVRELMYDMGGQLNTLRQTFDSFRRRYPNDIEDLALKAIQKHQLSTTEEFDRFYDRNFESPCRLLILPVFEENQYLLEKVEGKTHIKIRDPIHGTVSTKRTYSSPEIMTMQRMTRMARACLELVKSEVRKRIMSNFKPSMAERMVGGRVPSERQSPVNSETDDVQNDI